MTTTSDMTQSELFRFCFYTDFWSHYWEHMATNAEVLLTVVGAQ